MGMALSVAGQNITGRITCQGQGVEGVAVSDGDAVALTDGEGRYALQSEKRNGYVFYTLPSGYEPRMKNRFNPQFWARLSSPDRGQREEHDFELRRCNNTKFRMLVGADPHLAHRSKDLSQFRNGFIPALGRELKAAQEEGMPIYSMILGDLTWDTYWFANKYSLHDFMNTCKQMQYPMPLWPVIGNHDNDPSVQQGAERNDFLSSAPWRDVVCPNYYSFNLGKAHFIVLDNIYYKNEPKEGAQYAVGAAGLRNYEDYITPDQMAWLKKDLSLVRDRNTPIIVGFHIPAIRQSKDNAEPYAHMKDSCTERLCDLLKDYRQVHFLSGHTHYNYCAQLPQWPNVMEHNIDGICAIWWTSWLLSGRHNCSDGSPSGYSLWTFDGDRVEWRFKSIQAPYDSQFRVYDMNSVKKYYAESPTLRAMFRQYPDRKDYAQVHDNVILVNVYGYDDLWKVEILEDGTPLPVKRVHTEDPYHVLCYEVPFFKKHGRLGSGSSAKNTWHMFRAQCATARKPVTVRVTDRFGHVQERTLKRPAAYSLDMEVAQGSM